MKTQSLIYLATFYWVSLFIFGIIVEIFPAGKDLFQRLCSYSMPIVFILIANALIRINKIEKKNPNERS